MKITTAVPFLSFVVSVMLKVIIIVAVATG